MPTLTVTEKFESAGAYEPTLSQSTRKAPGRSEKPPRDIPVAFALIGSRTGELLKEGVIRLTTASAAQKFGPFRERPVASVLRGFSAPANVIQALSLNDRLLLAKSESDLFARWSATEGLWRDLCLAFASDIEMTDPDDALSRFADAGDEPRQGRGRSRFRRRDFKGAERGGTRPARIGYRPRENRCGQKARGETPAHALRIIIVRTPRIRDQRTV
ncbi:MAG: DUF3458 domain-containing protein [Parvularculaceae bacterium]